MLAKRFAVIACDDRQRRRSAGAQVLQQRRKRRVGCGTLRRHAGRAYCVSKGGGGRCSGAWGSKRWTQQNHGAAECWVLGAECWVLVPGARCWVLARGATGAGCWCRVLRSACSHWRAERDDLRLRDVRALRIRSARASRRSDRRRRRSRRSVRSASAAGNAPTNAAVGVAGFLQQRGGGLRARRPAGSRCCRGCRAGMDTSRSG